MIPVESVQQPPVPFTQAELENMGPGMVEMIRLGIQMGHAVIIDEKKAKNYARN